jgi:hypothetical protein
MSRLILLAVLLIGGLVALAGRRAEAQQQDLPPMTPQRHYNGIVAGEEAYLGNSLRRRGEIARQYDLNADMFWRWSGISSWYPGVFEAWPMVPGSVFGWPALNAPPRITSTSIAPPNVVVAEPRGANPAVAERKAGAEPRTAPARPAPTSSASVSGGGLLPGFVPESESAGQSKSRSPDRAAAGPRAF